MDFDALKVLVNTLTKNKMKHLDIYQPEKEAKTKIGQLYDGISSGLFPDEKSAIAALYDSPEDALMNYKQVKKRLAQQLINTVFFIDVKQPQFNDRTKALYNGYKDFASAYILIARGAHLPATVILENTLEQAIKYEHIELCAEITRFLRFTYNRRAANSPKHKYYVQKHREFEMKRYWEMHANDYFETLAENYQNRRYPREQIVKEAKQYFEELNQNLSKVNTAFCIYYTYQCGVIGHFAENNIPEVLKLSELALDKMNQNSNSNIASITSLSIQKMVCLVQLRQAQNKENHQFFEQCISINEPGHFNWYKIYEIYFYYNAYTKNYKKCLEIYSKVCEQANFPELPSKTIEMWRLMGQYLNVLAKATILDQEETKLIIGNAKLGRFLNEMDLLNQDTSGMNIPILLLPFVFQILGERDADHIRSWEALEQYRKRHLNNRLNERSNSFVKLLYALSYFYSSKKEADKIIAREVKFLQDNAPKIAGQSLWIEVIPYEDLWEILKKYAPKW